jgi:hypothetical protein
MRRIILVFVIAAICTGSAEARRFHFHRHGWGHIPRNLSFRHRLTESSHFRAEVL